MYKLFTVQIMSNMINDDELPPAFPDRPDEYQPPLPRRHNEDYRPTQAYPSPPPRRRDLEVDDTSSPIFYGRDPKKLVGYMVPFPIPKLHNIPSERVPHRFLLYTPAPPPLVKPAEGEKEAKAHKVQRKWQQEVREAKTSTAKTMSWKGVKSKATKAISWGVDHTTTSSLDFLSRVGDDSSHGKDSHADDGHDEGEVTKKTVKLEEMLLVYPASMQSSNEQLREEFVNTMLRSKSKAQRDSVIATGLLPVSLAVDILATLIWPFGGLFEIDSVWLYASIRGAKTSRSVTKRLTSSSTTGDHDKDTLQLNFVSSPRLEVLARYLAAECHKINPWMFASPGVSPSETEVMNAIGWTPVGGEDKNWEDEAWESSQVKEDMKSVMHKGGNEWVKWCKLFEKQPEKAMKK